MIKILILEDDVVDQMALTRLFNRSIPDTVITLCLTIKEALVALTNETFDWVISDYNLPDGTILDILQYASHQKMICVSGEISEEKINEMMSKGLIRFLVKDQSLNYLKLILSEINNSPWPSKKSDIQMAKPELSFLLNNLKENFGDEKESILEVLNIFFENIIDKDLLELFAAIKNKNQKQTNFLAHKIQSSFRVFGVEDVLKTLSEIEQRSVGSNLDWKRILTSGELLKNQSENFSTIVRLLQKELLQGTHE